MNFIIENLKNSKTILIVSGLVAVIVFGALLVGYENYLRTLIGPAGEKAALYPDQSIAASYVISDHESWNLGNCCSSSPDISAGDYRNELALGYYCHNRDGEFTRLYRRITLRFDLSSLPDGASIYSAKLYLKPSKILYSQDASIYGASNDNWEEANCFDPKQMKPCPQSAAAFQPGSLSFQDKVNINNTNWKNWNVTNFVYSKQNSGSKYVTLHLIGSAENLTVCNCDNCWDKRAVNFWGPRSSQKPYLLINYSGGDIISTTCTQHFEVRNENNEAIANSQVTVGGSFCATNSDGSCSIELKTNETHTAKALKNGYECYDNKCSKTFTGCPPEWISLFLKKTVSCSAGLTLCGGKCVNLNSDFYNCGYCGNKCSSDYKCQSGTCVKEEAEAIYSISGKVLKDGSGLSGITINFNGTSLVPTTTDSSGSYSFNNLTDGSYTITPSNNNYIFAPISHTITIPKGCITTNMNNINFNAISKECNLEETKNYTCPDGTEVDWCSCDNYKWACIDSPENNCPATCACGEWIAQTCGGGSCPDTDMHWTRICAPSGCDSESKCWWDSICNASCEADGKCKIGCPNGDPDCSCSQQSGNVCQTNETCPETSLKHSGSRICCSVSCKNGATVYQTADLNCDGSVNAGDMAIVLSWWDRNPSGFTCCQTPDIDGDGTANAGDYAIMMSQWTEMTL